MYKQVKIKLRIDYFPNTNYFIVVFFLLFCCTRIFFLVCQIDDFHLPLAFAEIKSGLKLIEYSFCLFEKKHSYKVKAEGLRALGGVARKRIGRPPKYGKTWVVSLSSVSLLPLPVSLSSKIAHLNLKQRNKNNLNFFRPHKCIQNLRTWRLDSVSREEED